MKVQRTALAGVVIIEPKIFRDARGLFYETWQTERYAEAGVSPTFVQDNVSCSRKGTIRGLHFQSPGDQGKLVSVLSGRIFDVVVDIRRQSPTFRQWVGLELDAQARRQIWIPAGYAHGFAALEDETTLFYKCDAPYRPDCERTVCWNDPDLGIDWPVADPLLSDKDGAAPRLRDHDVLPVWSPSAVP